MVDYIILLLVGVVVGLGYFFALALRDYRAVVRERDALFDMVRGLESNLAVSAQQLKRARQSIDHLENEYSLYRDSSDDVIDKLIDQALIV